MTATTTTQPTTHSLVVPGATLAYDIRRNAESTEPILVLIGSPMGAGGFPTLAGHFADRTVVTYDPRGTERSQKTDPMDPSPPRYTPMTCIGSSRPWVAGRSTCSPAAVAR